MGTDQAAARPPEPSPSPSPGERNPAGPPEPPASRQWPAVQAPKAPMRAKVLPGIAPSARAMPTPIPSGTRANSAGAPGTGTVTLRDAALGSPSGPGPGPADSPAGGPAGRGAHLAATPTRRPVARSASSGPASTRGALEEHSEVYTAKLDDQKNPLDMVHLAATQEHRAGPDVLELVGHFEVLENTFSRQHFLQQRPLFFQVQ